MARFKFNPLTGQFDLVGASSSGGGSPGSGYELMNGPDYSDPTYTYVGLEKATGAWYIYRRHNTTNIRTYAQGSSNYSTNWTNRGSLSYS